jgi:crotonobetainyl-CoA:carnitine CoA-transferase CaiB-like acyl-CoA transferase
VGLAFAGLLNITGYPDRPPVRPGVAIGDYQTAMLGAFGLMMSLYEAKLSGKGRQVDISLYETVFRFTEVLASEYDQFGIVRERRGNDYFAAAPGSTFETSDRRSIILTISSQPFWRRLCEAMDRPDLVDHPDFATHDDRWKNIGAINDIVAQWIKSEPIDVIARKLDSGGLAYAHVLNIADQFEDPHYKARNTIATVDHPVIGPLRMPGVVPRLSDGPPAPIRPAPALGSGNDAIFRCLLGMTGERMAELKSSGVI